LRHGVRLSVYTGGDLDLSIAEGAYYGGMETLRAQRESAVKSAAGSSMLSSTPYRRRERRASSAPVRGMAARSSALIAVDDCWSFLPGGVV